MRPVGVLSPSLLARKGEARPAMRSVVLDGPDTEPSMADDLPSHSAGAPVAEPGSHAAEAAALPPVLIERAGLGLDVAQIIARRGEAPCVTQVPRSGATSAGKVAFTLRLPAKRHLRLRLASALLRRSAQSIVTEALDALLSTLPEVEALARRCASTAEPEDRS